VVKVCKTLQILPDSLMRRRKTIRQIIYTNALIILDEVQYFLLPLTKHIHPITCFVPIMH
jgi:hypothetical protein